MAHFLKAEAATANTEFRFQLDSAQRCCTVDRLNVNMESKTRGSKGSNTF